MATLPEYLDSLTTEVRRIGKKLDGIRGDGVANTPVGISITSATPKRAVLTPPPQQQTAGQYQGMVIQTAAPNQDAHQFFAAHTAS